MISNTSVNNNSGINGSASVSSTPAQVTFKVNFDGDIRRFRLAEKELLNANPKSDYSSSLSDGNNSSTSSATFSLLERVRNLYSSSLPPYKKFSLKWQDNEGDLISITPVDDLSELIYAAKLGTIKLFVELMSRHDDDMGDEDEVDNRLNSSSAARSGAGKSNANEGTHKKTADSPSSSSSLKESAPKNEEDGIMDNGKNPSVSSTGIFSEKEPKVSNCGFDNPNMNASHQRPFNPSAPVCNIFERLVRRLQKVQIHAQAQAQARAQAQNANNSESGSDSQEEDPSIEDLFTGVWDARTIARNVLHTLIRYPCKIEEPSKENGNQASGLASTESAETPASSDAPRIHHHVLCDGCSEGPIIGTRFKCIQCKDYDLCSKCEASGIHSEHVLARIYNPLSQQDSPVAAAFLGGRHHGWGGRSGRCPGLGRRWMHQQFQQQQQQAQEQAQQQQQQVEKETPNTLQHPMRTWMCCPMSSHLGHGGRRYWRAQQEAAAAAQNAIATLTSLPSHSPPAFTAEAAPLPENSTATDFPAKEGEHCTRRHGLGHHHRHGHGYGYPHPGHHGPALHHYPHHGHHGHYGRRFRDHEHFREFDPNQSGGEGGKETFSSQQRNSEAVAASQTQDPAYTWMNFAKSYLEQQIETSASETSDASTKAPIFETVVPAGANSPAPQTTPLTRLQPQAKPNSVPLQPLLQSQPAPQPPSQPLQQQQVQTQPHTAPLTRLQPAARSENDLKVQQLKEMGFYDEQLIRHLLQVKQGQIDLVVVELLAMDQYKWV